ncbi:MAG: hypothetical protein RL637_1390 [Pseudomonadota bacterium]|jgi:vitamin B12 transporter
MQKTLLSMIILTSLPSILFADEPVADLSEVVVTATRSDIQQNQLATATTVFTRQQIEQLQVKTLPDLLKTATGIDMAQTGGYGQPISLFMRGNNTDHVLVLVDGIKIGSVSAGISPLQLLPIEQIERVEIVRGPQSSLYGSEAIGGVIQIFTRSGKKLVNDQTDMRISASGGSYDTYQGSGSINGKWQNSWYSLGVSALTSQGFSAQTLPANPDHDGYHNTAVNARVGHRFGNGAEIEAFLTHIEGNIEFDSFSENKSQFVEQVIGFSATMELIKNWQSTLRFGHSTDNNHNYTPQGQFSSHFDSHRWNVSWINQFKFNEDQQLIIGSDGRLDEIDSSTLYTQKSRYDIGVFAELHSHWLENHFTNLSIRWDNNQAFGDYVTGNVGWRYQWLYGISLLANFGNAFKAPAFNQLYWPNNGYGGGNPELKAERSTSFEVGLTGEYEWGRWELRAYHTDIDHLINGWPPVNINKAEIEGIESMINANWLGWHGQLSMNLLNPKDRATQTRLIRRVNKSLSFDLSHQFNQLEFGIAVLAQGNRQDIYYDDYYQQQYKKIAGYVTVDLRSKYSFDKQWSIAAKLNNLFNKDYQTVNNYNMANRNFMFTVEYRY